jgi:hypothetical protein
LFGWFVYELVDMYCLTSAQFVYGLLINGCVFGLIKKVNLFAKPHTKQNGRNRCMHVLLKQSVKESKRNYGEAIPHPTVEGTIGQNEMDTHADTCCADANWKLLDSTNEVCEVTPFLDLYEPVKEVMVTRCGTVWTSPDTGHESLLVGDQMLWFSSQMDHSLINPNQICEYGLPVYDDPFSKKQFGIDGNKAFIPFNTTGTIVYFETSVPTDWETRNLPIIMLTGEEWDPVNVGLGTGQSREQAKM